MADNKQPQNISAADAAAIKENKELTSKLPKALIGISVAVIIIVATVLCYVYFVRQPGIQKAQEQAAKVYVEALDKQSSDSIVAAAAASAAKAGYDDGNNMHLVAAINYYRLGQYDKCIAQLDEFKAKDAIIGAAAKSLLGDAYVNTDKLDQAADAFTAAIKQSDNNPQYTPMFMLKLARVYREQNKTADELRVLNEIKAQYPVFAEQNAVDAYIARLNK